MAVDPRAILEKHKNKIFHAFLILIGLYVALLIYKNQTHQSMQLSEKKDSEAKRNVMLEEIQQVEGIYGEYKRYVNKKDVNTIINTLSNLATQGSGVKITSLKPAPERNSNLYIDYPYICKIEANNYHTLGRFISRLESHPDIFNVNMVHLSPQSGPAAGGKTKLTVDLEVSTLWLKD